MEQPVTHQQMISMFSSYQEANIEIIRSMQTAVNATTKAETDRIDVKLDGVIKRQDKVNGSVAKNTKTTEKVNRFSRNIKWYALGLFGFCYAVCWIYSTFNLEEIVLKLIHKI